MYLAPASAPDLAAAVAAAPRRPDDTLLVLLAEDGAPPLPDLVAALAAEAVPFVGAVFPRLLAEGREVSEGAVVLSVPAAGPPVVVSGLDGAAPDVSGVDVPDGGTALVFVDSLAANPSGFLQALGDRFGTRIGYLGGGAGSLSLEQAPCVFTEAGAFQDAAVVLPVAARAALGVRHGWERLAGPLVATRTHQGTVAHLNWEPAASVYARAVAPAAGRPIEPASFFETASGFPFGLTREGDEDVVRDPFRLDGEAIDCFGDVPENAVIYILRGEPEALVEAAGRAAREAVGDAPKAAPALVIDCISRSLFLGEQFGRETAALADAFVAAGRPAPDGALTLGEIASDGSGLLQFYNKTCVAAALVA
ncbi:MAG: FIST C-terminal domain-containing protein [Bacteroidota bacterium]